jgi:hypothetical protein
MKPLLIYIFFSNEIKTKLYPWLIENNHKSVTLVTKIESIPELMQHAVAIIRKSLALNTLDAIAA